MTISSTTRIAGPFVGNGTATVFPFTFKVFAAADLDVVRLAVSTGFETTLVLNSDYSVTLNGDQNSNPGGSITLLAGALATGSTLVITSDIANLQPTDLTNQGGFYPEVITDALDRATIQIQQISDIGDRTLKIPITDGSLNMELPTADARANSFLAFDANGLPSVVTAGSSGAPATITRQVFSGTGSQTVFTLASDPGALGNSAQVYIGGVYQQRSTYTIAGTTLTFSAAPVAGTDNIEFVNFLTSSIGATSADLVTYTPAGTGAVARSAASKFGDVVSVKDFGAVGDGTTDDTVAIRNAIAYCGGTTGKSLYFPEGTYIVNNQPGDTTSGTNGILYANRAITMFGAGVSRTRIKIGASSTAYGLLRLTIGGTGWDSMGIGPGTFGWELSGMTLDGNGTDKWCLWVGGQYGNIHDLTCVRASGSGGYGMRLEGCTLSRISNCDLLYNFNGLGGGIAAVTAYVDVSQVSVGGCVGYHEVEIGTGFACTSWTFDSLYCETDGNAPNHRAMVQLNNCRGFVFTNFGCETFNGAPYAVWTSPYDHLIDMDNCWAITFDGGYVSHKGGSNMNGFFADDTCNNVTIRNMLFRGVSGALPAPTGFTCIFADVNTANLTIDGIVTEFDNALVGVKRPNGTGAPNLTIQSFTSKSGFVSPTFDVDSTVAGTCDGLNRVSATHVVFPAAPVYSSRPTVLDEYLESTWTPTLVSSNADMTVTYTTQNGVYTKIGRVVMAQGTIKIASVTAAGTGYVRIAGLPVSAIAGPTGGTASIGVCDAWVTNFPTSGIVNAGATNVNLYRSTTTAASVTVPTTAVQANTEIQFTVIYTAAN